MLYPHRNFNSDKMIGLANPVALIEYKTLRFIIMDAPTETSINLYIQVLKKHNVTDVVRVCEATYSKSIVEESGMKVHDLVFQDGGAPPQHIIDNWLYLVSKVFRADNDKLSAIAVHCVAGLGRAPVLVAISLIEAGMGPLDSVSYIRQHRRGAINQCQIDFLVSYSRKKKASTKCVIM